MSVRNTERPNGKALKQGKHPRVREVELRAKREAQAAKRAAKKK